MVSIRCKMIVKAELKKLGLLNVIVALGEANIMQKVSRDQIEKLRIALHEHGLEIVDDKKSMIIEKIKNVIVEMVHYSDVLPKVKFSSYLSKKLGYDYTYLSNLFSETEAITIEQFIISHKIERVKELIMYDELNLSQITDSLHYSSVAHLSCQFKKVTGLTPTYFKSLKDKRRSPLEDM